MKIERFTPEEKKASEERIKKLIEEYDSQGIHRTGTEGDSKNAQWLADHIKALGLNPNFDTFNFKRISIKEASIII